MTVEHRFRVGPLLGGGLALLLANCSHSVPMAGRHASEVKYRVKSSPRVVADGEPVPKGGGRDMVGKPYVVAGRTYVPAEGRGYDREGWASWYGTAFHGRLTANGEVFDRESIAAAHPTLPLPSYVRVTNVVNKRSMIVRVNDRGPYERDRIIDLSERAADALGFHRRGTSRVRVEYVGRASLNGSDDAKLLASLTTDGLPARLDPGSRPVMVADAAPALVGGAGSRSGEGRGERPGREEPGRRVGPSEPIRLTGLPPSRELAGVPTRANVRTAQADVENEDDDEPALPPRRPSFR